MSCYATRSVYHLLPRLEIGNVTRSQRLEIPRLLIAQSLQECAAVLQLELPQASGHSSDQTDLADDSDLI